MDSTKNIKIKNMKNDQLIKVRFSKKDIQRIKTYKAETGVSMTAFIRSVTLKELKKLGY